MGSLNLDRTRLSILDYDQLPWVASPSSDVERKLLERESAESGLATSIVRYGAGASFPSHEHHGGEEFLVLQGTFSDEHGDYPAGTYVRNPIGSRHRPFSREGCIIFVKLWQMRGPEQRTVVDTTSARWQPGPGAEVLRLHDDASERVTLERLRPGQGRPRSGVELLVAEGAVRVDGGPPLAAHSWIRIPTTLRLDVQCPEAAVVWIKEGHL